MPAFRRVWTRALEGRSASAPAREWGLSMKTFRVLALCSVLSLAACGGGGDDGDGGGEDVFLPFASQSSAVMVSPDETRLVAVNENADSVSVFDITVDPPALVKEVAVGDEPVAVVIGPDNDSAFVVNQASATVSKLAGLKGNPAVVDTAEVGAEPVGLALAPSGKSLFVSELAQGRVLKLDAESLEPVAATAAKTPFGIAVTNDLDRDDNDETVIVTQFYGTPINGATDDDSRRGEAQLLRVSDLGSSGTVLFQPRSSQVSPVGSFGTARTSPNQLYAVSVLGDRFFVPTIAVSPAGPVQVRGGNVRPLILVGSVSGKNELAALSVNLEKKIQDLLPTEDGKRNFLSDTTSLAVSASESDASHIVLYAVSRGGDAVQRVLFNLSNNQVSIDDFDGNGKPDQIDLFPACRTPMGISVLRNSPKAFVNCRGTRKLVTLDLGQQVATSTVPTSTPPAAGSEEFEVERGQLLFFTARARWSVESRSDCAACHANGTLSDNVVWSFATGPRRTIPMHWTYQDRDGDGVKETQKILNWTAIFDEIRDFEGNITNVSGGRGVLTTAENDDASNPANCDVLGDQGPSLLDGDANGVINGDDTDELLTNNGFNDVGLAGSVLDLETANEARLCAGEDWDEVDAFTRTMRSPRAPKTFGDAALEASIARGRGLFAEAGCFKCHGGPGWTSSELFYPVTRDNTLDLAAGFSIGNPNSGIGPFDDQELVDEFGVGSGNNRNIQTENGGDAAPGIAPLQVSCVLRNVGTFGDPDNPGLTTLLEIKNGNSTQIAQGSVNGYNVPNLLGVALNAPYFHHGLAKTLDELLTDPSWADHLTRANPAFALQGAGEFEDLKNFLLSIDEDTPAFDLNDVVDLCDTAVLVTL